MFQSGSPSMPLPPTTMCFHPLSVCAAIVGKNGLDDVALQRRTEQRERHAHRFLRLQRVVRVIELRDVFPPRGVAGDALRETRPGVAVMRLDEDVDLIVADERRADLVIDDDRRGREH